MLTRPAGGKQMKPNTWREMAPDVEGAGWPIWFEWLAARAGEETEPPQIGAPEYAVHQSRSRWRVLADHLLTRDVREAGVEARQMADAADWSALTSSPMVSGWRWLNHGDGNTRDLALTALNSHAVFDAGMRRSLAQWQLEAARALSASRNAMPFNGVTRNLTEIVEPSPPAIPALKDQRR